MKAIFPSIKINTTHSAFKTKRIKPKNEDETVEPIPNFNLEKGNLVWQKHNLKSSDAQQVKGDTNVTGVLRLGQADFKVNGKFIDKNNYFREVIFVDLDWIENPRPNNSPLQTALTDFDFIISDTYYGTFNLKLSHDLDRIANQNNVPTTLHWGKAIIKILKENNVIGKRLNLYAPTEIGEPFTIEIL